MPELNSIEQLRDVLDDITAQADTLARFASKSAEFDPDGDDAMLAFHMIENVARSLASIAEKASGDASIALNAQCAENAPGIDDGEQLLEHVPTKGLPLSLVPSLPA